MKALNSSENYKLFAEKVMDLLPVKEFQLMENSLLEKQTQNCSDNKNTSRVCFRDNLTVIAYLLSWNYGVVLKSESKGETYCRPRFRYSGIGAFEKDIYKTLFKWFIN